MGVTSGYMVEDEGRRKKEDGGAKRLLGRHGGCRIAALGERGKGIGATEVERE